MWDGVVTIMHSQVLKVPIKSVFLVQVVEQYSAT